MASVGCTVTVSRRMWQGLWPDFAEREIPIAHVTNGVHLHTWISLEMAELFDRYLGDTWRLVSADERRLGPGLWHPRPRVVGHAPAAAQAAD